MESAERTELDLWPYQEARRLAERIDNYPPDREVIFESGFGPSGLPHLGTMGEVLRQGLEEDNHTVVEIGFPSGQLQYSYGHARMPGSGPDHAGRARPVRSGPFFS